MLQSIVLTNFQSHKHSVVPLADGVNAIVGNTGAGKTAVLRAIYWVVMNWPLGDGFISHWAKETSATLVFDDGISVTRGIDSQGNYYQINNEKKLRAFKAEVPEEVQQILNLADLNLQSQLDMPFMFSLSPGARAQSLNKTVNLDIIDQAISNIRKRKMEVDRRVKSNQEQVAQVDSQLKEFQYLSQMETDVVVFETMLAKEREVRQSGTKLADSLVNAMEARDKLQAAQKVLKFKEEVQEALQIADEYYGVFGRRQTLSDLIETAQGWENSLNSAKLLTCLAGEVGEACGMVHEIEELASKRKILAQKVENYKIQQGRVESLGAKLSQLRAEFAAKFPAVCPLCGK